MSPRQNPNCLKLTKTPCFCGLLAKWDKAKKNLVFRPAKCENGEDLWSYWNVCVKQLNVCNNATSAAAMPNPTTTTVTPMQSERRKREVGTDGKEPETLCVEK